MQHDGFLPLPRSTGTQPIENRGLDQRQGVRPMEIDHGSVCHCPLRADRMVLCIKLFWQSYTSSNTPRGDEFLADDCSVYGSDESLVGVYFCMARSRVTKGAIAAGEILTIPKMMSQSRNR
jgi:hypothetical protein